MKPPAPVMKTCISRAPLLAGQCAKTQVPSGAEDSPNVLRGTVHINKNSSKRVSAGARHGRKGGKMRVAPAMLTALMGTLTRSDYAFVLDNGTPYPVLSRGGTQETV
ncbi:hypothetical protein JCM14124_05600 [Humidesulfovibrio idahonensis]